MKLCDYGCGQEAKHQFKNGKWCCSKHWNSCPIIRKKIGKKMKGKNTGACSEETKKKISESKKGHIPYNKGIPCPEETKRKISKSLKGIPCPEERKRKISKSLKGIITWNKGKIFSKEQKLKLKLTIKRIKNKYPFFSKIEEMRYDPNKPEEKEIQVHCKNHECENSKEKGGWFTPTYIQLYERIRQIENDGGNGGGYFYCSQECKDMCPLYHLRGDPLKDNTKPYTYQENQLWRQIILELDKDLCQFCGKPATDVHHIKPVKTHPHLALDPDNGISFCEKCHYKIGHKTGSECSTGNLANKVQQGCVLGSQL